MTVSVETLGPREQDVPRVLDLLQIVQDRAGVRSGRGVSIALHVFARQAAAVGHGFRIVVIHVILIAGRTVTAGRGALVLERPSAAAAAGFLLLIGFLLALGGCVLGGDMSARLVAILRETHPAALDLASGFVITTVVTITIRLGRGV